MKKPAMPPAPSCFSTPKPPCVEADAGRYLGLARIVARRK
jgi:hypothetical protein